jgi:hypothetical protein
MENSQTYLNSYRITDPTTNGTFSIAAAKGGGGLNGAQFNNVTISDGTSAGSTQAGENFNILGDIASDAVDNGANNGTSTYIGVGTINGIQGVIVYDPNGRGGGYFLLTGVTLSVGTSGVSVLENPGDPSTWWYPGGTAAPSAPSDLDFTDNVGTVQGSFTSGTHTDDTTPALTGTASAGSTVDLYLDGSVSPAATVYAAANGQWSWTPSTPLPEGTYSYTATQTNTAGAVSTTSSPFTVTVDTAAPAAPSAITVTDNVGSIQGLLADGAQTDDNTLTLTGTAEVGSTVRIFNGITQVGIATADGTGNWSATTTALPEGAASLTATATDAAGNTSAASAARSVIVETFSVVCYAAGTAILTAAGEKRVEALTEGDIILTLAGEKLHQQPVRWVGRRRIELTTHPRPETVAPVCIRRGTFTDNIPHRDLLVSPNHAIFVDGKLICAQQLINGTTILQVTDRTAVEYFHIELDVHAILLAEGLPAESYLDTGNRRFFANSGKPLLLHPDLTDDADHPLRETASCAPFVSDEANVRPVWQRLAERAAALGQPIRQPDVTADPELRIIAAGRSLLPLYRKDGLHVFGLPRNTTDVRVVSRAGSPTDVRPWLSDRRRLGVPVERIVLRDDNSEEMVSLDHPSLSQGWWPVERDGMAMHRWTDGAAVLPLPEFDRPILLELRVGTDGMSYIIPAEQARRVG